LWAFGIKGCACCSRQFATAPLHAVVHPPTLHPHPNPNPFTPQQDDMEDIIDKDEELGPDELEAGQAAAAYRAVNRQADDRTEEELAKYIEERYK